jgi:vitamin B12 transporter
MGGQLAATRIGLSLAGVDSAGTNSSRTGPEEDGYDNSTATLTLASSPAEGLELSAIARYTDVRKEFDGTDFIFTGLPIDTADLARTSFGYYSAGGTLKLRDDRWVQDLRATLATSDIDNSNEFGANGSTAAETYGIHYQTTWYLAQPPGDGRADSITLAADYQQQDFSQRGLASTFGDPNQDQDMDIASLVGEYLMTPFRQTSMSFSVRYDDNSDYDNIFTYRATGAWTAEGWGTRLHASYGTGQKAPTFIERFGFFPDQFQGNPDLEPEESEGWEVGVEQPLAGRRLSLGLTYFDEDLTNEINGFVFDPGTGAFTAENTPGKSKRRGVELVATARPLDNFSLSASYTYLDATQPDPFAGGETTEIRRPENSASLNANLLLLSQRLNLNLNLAYVGSRDDLYFEVLPPFGTQVVNLESYTLGRLAASYQLTSELQVYGRVENLFDENYEDVYGYATPGRGVYGGLRVSF